MSRNVLEFFYAGTQTLQKVGLVNQFDQFLKKESVQTNNTLTFIL